MRISRSACFLACLSTAGATFAKPRQARPLFDAEIIVRPAFNAWRSPDWTADHALVKEVYPIGGPIRVERARFVRSGSRYKLQVFEPSERSPSFTDLRARTYVTLSVDSDGKYEHFSIERPEPVGTYDTHRRWKTGEKDRALGEDCDVWSTRRVSKNPSSLESDWLTCLTSDGIELWTKIRRIDLDEDDEYYSKTISIERRKVDLSEVLPPKDLLDRSKWAGQVSEIRLADSVPDHEVTLEGTDNEDGIEPKRISSVIREQKPWSYRETREHDGGRRWFIQNRSSGWTLRARQLGDGSLHSISTYSHDRVLPRLELTGKGIHNTILGEDCEVVWPARPTPHDERAYCRTSDGVLLREINEDSRYGDMRRLEAVSVKRETLAPEKSMIPPVFLEAERWKIWPK